MKFLEHQLDMRLREMLPLMQERIINQTSYFGVKAMMNPLDWWVYQELLFETKPDVIVEIGNAFGGTLLALAHLCDLLGRGSVVGVDVSHDEIHDSVRSHQRIALVEGDACSVYEQVAQRCQLATNVLVIEDSAHTFENTLKVLRTYNGLIRPGGYFIVEDGICHHGLEVGPSPGPYEAVEAFVAEQADFQIDRGRESFLITWNPKGYLKRLR